MSSPAHSSPAAALARILATVETVRAAAVQPASSTTVIAVSKTHAAERIIPLLEEGHRVFGESRVQEARAKWLPLRERFGGIELHLIGPLQTNKVREAVGIFDVIQTLDRQKLAEALKAEFVRSRTSRTILVQVNTGEEPQKAGVAPRDALSFIAWCRDELGLPVHGLMCIPPVGQPPAPHFALLKKIARAHDLPFLSMGMSDDFETAIRFGATHVRIGTAIFGARESARP
jgi:PLP dependent protein